MTPRHFLRFSDFSRADFEHLLGRARWIKSQFKQYRPYHPLVDRTLAMIFEKQSTRTRLSFEAGVQQLGGVAIQSPSSKKNGCVRMRQPISKSLRSLGSARR